MPNNAAPQIRYVLDTDIVTYQQLGRRAVVQRLRQVNLAEVATTVITMYEQLRGRLADITAIKPLLTYKWRFIGYK
jgi:predicted nucleic acid-binding protein